MRTSHTPWLLLAGALALLGSPLTPAAWAAPPSAPKKAPVEIDGAAVYRSSCNRCHNARSIEDLDPARWEVVATHMMVRGNLPKRDVDALLRWMNPPQAAGQEQWAVAAQAAFPEVPLIAERCVRCHDVSRVQDALAAGRDDSWWAATLRRMRSYGAKLNPKEESSMTEALTTTRAVSPEE